MKSPATGRRGVGLALIATARFGLRRRNTGQAPILMRWW
jgi:hypothetical protein